MAVHLRPFPADSAEVVSGWARTREEVIMWCGRPAASVPAAQINAWAREDGVQPFGLYRDGRLVAYGELWIDDDEAASCGSIRTTSPRGVATPERASSRSPRIWRPCGTRPSQSSMCGSALPRKRIWSHSHHLGRHPITS